jgi:hypothetical protein
MMEAVRTSETSVDNHFTRQYNPEDSSEYVLTGQFSSSYAGQEVGGALNVMELPTTKIDEPIHLHPEDGN